MGVIKPIPQISPLLFDDENIAFRRGIEDQYDAARHTFALRHVLGSNGSTKIQFDAEKNNKLLLLL